VNYQLLFFYSPEGAECNQETMSISLLTHLFHNKTKCRKDIGDP